MRTGRLSGVKCFGSLLLALASIGFLTLVATPAVPLAGPQEPPDERTGGLARTEKELGALGRLAEMPELTTLQQKAINAYNQGLAYRNKAWQLDEKAAKAEGEKAAKRAARAQKSYHKAIGQFRLAIERVPDFHQALGGLGYALLKTGQYEQALEAYDRALAIGPRYSEAIEERGEAYLGLDRIQEARSAYTQLVEVDRERAAELMTAMKRWVDQRRGDAGGLSEATIESFAVWIEERSEPTSSPVSSEASPGQPARAPH